MHKCKTVFLLFSNKKFISKDEKITKLSLVTNKKVGKFK